MRLEAETPSPDGNDAEGGPVEPDRITTSTRDPAGTRRHGSKDGWRGAAPGVGPAITGVSSPAEQRDVLGDPAVHRGLERGRAGRTPAGGADRAAGASTYPVFTTYDLGMQFRGDATGARPHRGAGSRDPLVRAGPGRARGPFFVMERVEGQVPPDVLPYTFGDNWVFEESDGRPPRDPGVGRRAPWPASTPSPPTQFDLSFLESRRSAGRQRARALASPLARLPRLGGEGPALPAAGGVLRLAGGPFPHRGGRRRSVVGRRPDRQHDVPRQPGGGRARLGDGGRRAARGRPRVDVLPPPVLPGSGRPTWAHPACPTCSARWTWPPSYATDVRARAGSTSPGTSPTRRSGTVPSCAGSPSARSSSARPNQPEDIDDLIMHRATLRRHAGRHLLGRRRPLTRDGARLGAGRHARPTRITSPERGVGDRGRAAGWSPVIIGWQLPQPSAPVSRLVDADHRVAELVELAGHGRRRGSPRAVHRRRGAPRATRRGGGPASRSRGRPRDGSRCRVGTSR